MAKRPAKPKELKVESWPIDRPKPYPLNPRKIDIVAINKVAASLNEFGFQQPIVVDKFDVVIVGHTRLAAARQLGHETVPIVVASKLTPDQAKAYRLADNRTGQESEWDMELLPLQFGDLSNAGFDLALTGFDEGEIAAFIPTGGEGAGPEEFPDVDDDIETQHACPKCGYEWSGRSR